MDNKPLLTEYTIFFAGFTTIERIEIFFNKKYQKWLYTNSHKKDETVVDMKLQFFLKYDESGNITNANFSGTTKDGIPLTKTDFIKSELFQLNKLNTSGLYLDDLKRIEFYGAFLQDELKKEEVGQTSLKDKKYKENIWFTAGLKFATGEAQHLYEKYKTEKGHFRKVTKELGFEEHCRPYFSETLNDTNRNHLNIFSDPDKLDKIYQHCKENKIIVSRDFLKKLPPELT